MIASRTWTPAFFLISAGGKICRAEIKSALRSVGHTRVHCANASPRIVPLLLNLLLSLAAVPFVRGVTDSGTRRALFEIGERRLSSALSRK